jgi:hypothetical protein
MSKCEEYNQYSVLCQGCNYPTDIKCCKEPPSTKSTYVEPWVGTCVEENCQKHKEKVCCVCGKPATHGCDNTQFLVCGFPLCNDKVCDTIHEVMFHGWDLKKFMDWTGREHTEEEIDYINKYITETREKYKKLAEEMGIGKLFDRLEGDKDGK